MSDRQKGFQGRHGPAGLVFTVAVLVTFGLGLSGVQAADAVQGNICPVTKYRVVQINEAALTASDANRSTADADAIVRRASARSDHNLLRPYSPELRNLPIDGPVRLATVQDISKILTSDFNLLEPCCPELRNLPIDGSVRLATVQDISKVLIADFNLYIPCQPEQACVTSDLIVLAPMKSYASRLQ